MSPGTIDHIINYLIYLVGKPWVTPPLLCNEGPEGPEGHEGRSMRIRGAFGHRHTTSTIINIITIIITNIISA